MPHSLARCGACTEAGALPVTGPGQDRDEPKHEHARQDTNPHQRPRRAQLGEPALQAPAERYRRERPRYCASAGHEQGHPQRRAKQQSIF